MLMVLRTAKKKVLPLLAGGVELSTSAIRERLGVGKNTVHKHLQVLEFHGLVYGEWRRVKKKKDGRVYHVHEKVWSKL